MNEQNPHRVEIRTPRRHWIFDASKGTISICAVKPDWTGRTLEVGRVLVTISAEEIRDRPDLHRVWTEFNRAFFGQ